MCKRYISSSFQINEAFLKSRISQKVRQLKKFYHRSYIVTKRTKSVFLSPRLLRGVMKIFEKFIIPGGERLLF